MKPVISKQEFDKFMSIKGEVRGMAVKFDLKFVLMEKGKDGLRKLEKAMAQLGYPIKYEKINPMDFYPIGLKAITLLTIQRVFNFDEEKFVEIGRFGSRVPFVIRFFLKYLSSFNFITKEVETIWRKYYTVGNVKIVEYNKKKKYMIIRIENFRVHPLHCYIAKGYFIGVIQILGKHKVVCEETKCVFKGDNYNEFLLKWE